MSLKDVNRFFEKQVLKFDTSVQNVWLTSDLHLHHKNVIKYSKRPFQDIDQMNEAFITNWNSCVKENDIVFILGDFSFGGSSAWNEVLDKLNGKKYLILGNHDEKNLRQGYMSKFEKVEYMMHIYIDGQSIYLSHFPLLCFAGAYRGEESVWALSGHVHFNDVADGKDVKRLKMFFPTQYDVGVDANNYRPISFSELKEKIDQQKELGVNQYDVVKKTMKFCIKKLIKLITF